MLIVVVLNKLLIYEPQCEYRNQVKISGIIFLEMFYWLCVGHLFTLTTLLQKNNSKIRYIKNLSSVKVTHMYAYPNIIFG